jgi:hypothetical protein
LFPSKFPGVLLRRNFCCHTWHRTEWGVDNLCAKYFNIAELENVTKRERWLHTKGEMSKDEENGKKEKKI